MSEEYEQVINPGDSVTIMNQEQLVDIPKGRYLVGWSLNPEPSVLGNDIDFYPDDIANFTEDTTLYAVWKSIGGGDDMLDYKNLIDITTSVQPDAVVSFIMPFDGRLCWSYSLSDFNVNDLDINHTLNMNTIGASHSEDFQYIDLEAGDVISNFKRNHNDDKLFLIPYLGGRGYGWTDVEINQEALQSGAGLSINGYGRLKLEAINNGTTTYRLNWQKNTESKWVFIKLEYKVWGGKRMVVYFYASNNRTWSVNFGNQRLDNIKRIAYIDISAT